MTTKVATNPRRRIRFQPLTLTLAAAVAAVGLVVIGQSRAGGQSLASTYGQERAEFIEHEWLIAQALAATEPGVTYPLQPSDGVPTTVLTEAFIIAEHEALVAGWLGTSCVLLLSNARHC